MSACVAHEIKNPLSAMKMTVQMLKAEKPAPEHDVLLREIERLDLAASELSLAGPGPLMKAPCALDQVATEVMELLKPQLAHLGVRVDRRDGAVVPVSGDVNRLKRAVMNLVLNGAQAMAQGGILTVAVEGPRLSVTDTGPGIPASIRERIFEPFVTGRQDGVGLGLALTKRIVEDHGGRIGFETSDKGSRFWMELPANG